MNAYKFIASAILVAATGSVFAGDLLPFTEADQFVSFKTRAEVQADAVKAVHSGQVARGDLLPSDQFAGADKQQALRTSVRKESIKTDDSASSRHAKVERRIGS